VKILSDEEIRVERNSHNDAFYTAREFNADKAIAKAQHRYTLQQVVEWGEERCEEHFDYAFVKKRECLKCWQALKEEANGRADAEGLD